MIRRALLVALALMLLVPVLAEATMTPLRREGGGDRVPSAQLWAKGSGAMTFAGRLSVTGYIPARGLVTVTDRSGDARVYLAGSPQVFVDGRLRVRPAAGVLFVKGSDVSVQVVGVDLKFSVAGNGRAKLQGSGVFQLNSGKERSWSGSWISITPSSAERRRDERCANCSPRPTRL